MASSHRPAANAALPNSRSLLARSVAVVCTGTCTATGTAVVAVVVAAGLAVVVTLVAAAEAGFDGGFGEMSPLAAAAETDGAVVAVVAGPAGAAAAAASLRGRACGKTSPAPVSESKQSHALNY